jgi:hypothetical protein
MNSGVLIESDYFSDHYSQALVASLPLRSSSPSMEDRGTSADASAVHTEKPEAMKASSSETVPKSSSGEGGASGGDDEPLWAPPEPKPRPNLLVKPSGAAAKPLAKSSPSVPAVSKTPASYSRSDFLVQLAASPPKGLEGDPDPYETDALVNDMLDDIFDKE